MRKNISDDKSLSEVEEEINSIIELEGIDELEPVEVFNKDGIIKIKINKNIDRVLIEKINDIVEGLLVIKQLRIEFDLIGVDLKTPEIKEEFKSLIKKIEAVGGEVKKTSGEI